MSDVLTFVLIEVDQLSRRRVGELIRGTVLDAGGALVATPGKGRGGSDDPEQHLAAVFHLAGDAARTALELAARFTPPKPGAAGWMRMALCTGEAHDDSATLGGPALERARGLLGSTGPNQILVTASTAVMASAALPRGAELVDQGIRSLSPGHPPERVYELRGDTAADPEQHDDTSNLDWARRAAPGAVLGRDEPLARLDSAWKAALDGRRQVVLLTGEGGIGKTTVAAELALRRHAEGATVLYGRWDQESLAPYQAMREALGTYAQSCTTDRLRSDLEGRSDEIARLLPDVAARLGGVRAPLRGDPEGERLRLFEAIETWLDRIASRRQLLLVLDDLHWAGQASLQLLEHLRHAPGTSPLMLVLTAREGEMDATVRRHTERIATAVGQTVDPAERIELEGLDRGTIARLVEHTVGRPIGPDDEELVDWLARDTAGNPLFVQEVLRGVRDSDDPARALRTAREHVPDGLGDMVRWRLRQLPRRTAEVLTTAAVIGSSFDLDVLAAATGAAPVALRPVLQAAERAGLLRGPEPKGERHAFAHEVLRRGLLDAVHDPEGRRALHRRIAAALAERARDGEPVVASEVAQHYLQGADMATANAAVRWARNAAEAARRETAFEGAVRLLQDAVEVHDTFCVGGPTVGGVDAEDQAALGAELRLELAEAHDRAGDVADRDARHVEAAEIASRLDRTDLFVRAALGYGGRLPAATPPDPTARRLLEGALDHLPNDDSRSRALLLARLAQFRHLDASYEERRALSDEAVAIARRLEAPLVLATTLMGRCMALDGPGDAEDQLEVSAEIIRIGERTGDPDIVIQGARVRIRTLLMFGRGPEAKQLADTFAGLTQQVRHADHLRIATMLEGMWAAMEGRYDHYERLSSELRQRLHTAGHPQSRAIPLAQSFPVLWLRGMDLDPDRVAAVMQKQDWGPSTVWAFVAWLNFANRSVDRRARVLAEMRARDPDKVLDDLANDFMWWPTMIACALIASEGDARWATAVYERLAPYAGLNCVVGYSAFLGSVDHHLGTLALAAGDQDRAVDLLEAGLQQHIALGAEPFVALSSRWLAHALRQRGTPEDQPRAASLLDDSLALAERLDLRGLPDF